MIWRLRQKVQSECTFSLVVNLIMTEIFTSLLLLAYALMGGVAILAFGPTIKDLWVEKSGVNSTTYLVWLMNATIGSLYALFIVGDFVMLLISSLYAVCCCIVLSLNWRFEKRNRVITISVEPEALTVSQESLV
jgi:hypothetical protein